MLALESFEQVLAEFDPVQLKRRRFTSLHNFRIEAGFYPQLSCVGRGNLYQRNQNVPFLSGKLNFILKPRAGYYVGKLMMVMMMIRITC